MRFAIAFGVAGLALGPVSASAQDTPGAANPPAADAVGPRELQNFSLQGNVTRTADQPAQQQAAPSPSPRAAPAHAETAATPPPSGRQNVRAPTKIEVAPRPAVLSKLQVPPSQVASDFTRPLPPASGPTVAPVAAPEPTATSFPDAAETSSGTLAARHGLPLWPWILAAFALVGAAAFLFWRNRSRTAVAGGPQLDLFAGPEPAPAPAPRAAPPPPPRVSEPTPPLGIVSSGLRPWLEVSILPGRCILTDEAVTVEFELDLFNSGSAPARDVHVAAALVNAGEGQEQALASFFAQQPGDGERIAVIEPLKRIAVATQIVTPRAQVQALEIGGRLVFVPIIAFNANYRWASRAGQTSVSYLLGREGKADKLAPFRLDLGPRLFRGVGARLLPTGVRK